MLLYYTTYLDNLICQWHVYYHHVDCLLLINNVNIIDYFGNGVC